MASSIALIASLTAQSPSAVSKAFQRRGWSFQDAVQCLTYVQERSGVVVEEPTLVQEPPAVRPEPSVHPQLGAGPSNGVRMLAALLAQTPPRSEDPPVVVSLLPCVACNEPTTETAKDYGGRTVRFCASCKRLRAGESL